MQIKCARNCKTHIVVASDSVSRGTVLPDHVRREGKKKGKDGKDDRLTEAQSG